MNSVMITSEKQIAFDISLIVQNCAEYVEKSAS